MKAQRRFVALLYKRIRTVNSEEEKKNTVPRVFVLHRKFTTRRPIHSWAALCRVCFVHSENQSHFWTYRRRIFKLNEYSFRFGKRFFQVNVESQVVHVLT